MQQRKRFYGGQNVSQAFVASAVMLFPQEENHWLGRKCGRGASAGFGFCCPPYGMVTVWSGWFGATLAIHVDFWFGSSVLTYGLRLDNMEVSGTTTFVS